MGLAGPKTRFKISHDPNNTTWARNTDRFGHRILTAQGWKPGTHLGSQESAHAAHHTAASFSHVKVLLKDDNLGLGAKRGSERAENFGMAGFDDLLARLNGKSEEKIQEQKSKRRDAEVKIFVSERWGTMTFVSGGFLVGDQIVKSKDGRVPNGGGQSEEASTANVKSVKDSSKKRKRVEEEPALETIEEDEEPRLKKKKRKSNLRIDSTEEGEPVAKKEKKEKKSRKASDESTELKTTEKKSKKRKHAESSDESESDSSNKRRKSKSSKDDKSSRKAARKAEKEARKSAEKAEKAARKEARRLKKSKSSTVLPTPADSTSSSSPAPTKEEDPGSAAPPVADANLGRHAARRKYIMAKKAAIMDPQALREIFMVRSTI